MDTIGPSRWYWEASAEKFGRTESTAILGQLVVHHPFDVDSKQRDAWLYQIEYLKLLASAVSRSHFFLSSLFREWANEWMPYFSPGASYS